MSFFNKPKPVKDPIPPLVVDIDPLGQQKVAQRYAQQQIQRIPSENLYPSISRTAFEEIDKLESEMVNLKLTIKLRFLYDVEAITKDEYKSIGKMMHSVDPENWVIAAEIISQKMERL